jgi:hypothetical protein
MRNNLVFAKPGIKKKTTFMLWKKKLQARCEKKLLCYDNNALWYVGLAMLLHDILPPLTAHIWPRFAMKPTAPWASTTCPEKEARPVLSCPFAQKQIMLCWLLPCNLPWTVL